MWNLSFSETGGYDCMTGAWTIMRDNQIIVQVDQADYGQDACDYSFRSPMAEKVARLLFHTLESSNLWES